MGGISIAAAAVAAAALGYMAALVAAAAKCVRGNCWCYCWCVREGKLVVLWREVEIRNRKNKEYIKQTIIDNIDKIDKRKNSHWKVKWTRTTGV